VGDGTNPDGDTEAWMLTLPDTDLDGRPDYIDNCPDIANPSQQDTDGDGIGDACDDLLITTTSLPSARVGKIYSKQLMAVGGKPPYTWAIIEGAPPIFVTLGANDGLLYGDVQSTFLAFFTVQVTDDNGVTDTQALSISVQIPNCVNCHTD
jgi:hypothetical protein